MASVIFPPQTFPRQLLNVVLLLPPKNSQVSNAYTEVWISESWQIPRWDVLYRNFVDSFMKVEKWTPIMPMTISETGQMDGWNKHVPP
jgi:hypothetical protein